MGDKNKRPLQSQQSESWDDIPLIEKSTPAAESWDDIPLIGEQKAESPVPPPPTPIDWQSPNATIEPVTTQPAVVGSTGKTLSAPKPVVTPKKHPYTEKLVARPVRTPEEVALDRNNAIQTIAEDFSTSTPTLPQEYRAADNIHYTDPNNPIHKLTDPHGDPEYTSRYISQRIGQLSAMSKQAGQRASVQEPGSEINIHQSYNDQIKKLMDNAGKVVDLQLFNREYSGKKYTPELARTAMDAEQKRYQTEESKISSRIAQLEKSPADKQDEINTLKSDLREKQKQLERRQQEIKTSTKYDEVMLGAEKSALLGDKNARQDLANLRSGKPISPEAQYNYHLLGRDIINFGLENTQNENVRKEVAPHADIEGKKVVEANKGHILSTARARIGNKRYEDENPWVAAIVPSRFRADPTKEEIARYAKQDNLPDDVVEELSNNPQGIPKSASLLQQTGKGAFNFLAPSLYERGVRTAAWLKGAEPDAVEEMFPAGWQDQRGIAAKIAGNMPTEQNSFRNVRGALGMMAETVGMLATFGGAAKPITKAFEKLGTTATTGERLANFGIMGFEGYNNAYHEAKEIVGDKPEDESTRQLYAILSGAANGAIFSIHPPTKLVRNALGDVTKTGEQFLNEIKTVGLDGALQPSFASKYANYIKEIAKANGTIIAQADANKMAQNALSNLFTNDPEKKKSLTAGLADETMNTAISFLIPSVMGGVGAARMRNPLNRAATFDVGSHPERYRDYVNREKLKGNITDQQANKLFDGISQMTRAVENTPIIEDTNGNPLTPDEIKAYSFSILQESVLQKKLDDLSRRAEAAKLPVDKAQEQPIKKQIAELQSEREEIMKRAAKGMPAPKPEEEKKSEESLETSEQKDISLPSESLNESETSQKTEQDEKSNGSIQENDGRQVGTDNSEGAEDRPNPEVQRPADSEGRRQQEEDRVLNEEGPTTAIDVQQEVSDKETPAEPVLEKPKKTRRKFAEAEEVPQEKPTEEPAVQGSVATEVIEEPALETKTETPKRPELGGGLKNSIPEKKVKDVSLLSVDEIDKIRTQAPNVKPSENVEGVSSMAEEGIKEPLSVQRTQNDDGTYTYTLQNGHHRLDEAIRLGAKTLPVVVKERGVVVKVESIKPTEDASIQSKEQQQESREPGGEQEHARAEQARGEEAQPSAESSDSNIGGQAQEITETGKPNPVKRKYKRKPSEFQSRKSAVFSNDPSSFREAVLMFILSGQRIRRKDIAEYFGLSNNDLKTYLRKMSNEGTSVDHFVENYHHPDAEGRGPKPHFVDDTIAGREDFMEIWKDFAHDDQATLREIERITGVDKEASWPSEETESSGEEFKTNISPKDYDAYFSDDVAMDTHEETVNMIDDMDMSEEEASAIMEYAETLRGEDGMIDVDKADPFSDEYQKAFRSAASPAAKDLLDIIFSKDKKSAVDKLEKTISKYGKEKQPAAKPEVPVEESAASEGVSETTEPEAVGEEGDQKERIKEIDLQLQRERASQKLESTKRAAAEKSGDIEAANKHNANFYKKQERIDKLSAERADLEKEIARAEKEEKIQAGYNKIADKAQAAYDRNKERQKGGKFMSAPGISTKLPDKIMDYIVKAVISGIRKGANVHILIHRAITAAKEKFGDEAKELSYDNINDVRDYLDFEIKPPKEKPQLNERFRDVAEEWIADLRDEDVDFTYTDAINEVMEEDRLSEEEKEAIISYMDYRLNEVAPQHLPARPPSEDNLVAKHNIDETATSEYLNPKTTKDVFGEEGLEDNEKERKIALQLNKLRENVVDIARSYQRELGGLASKWGARMFSDIKELSNDPKRQAIATASLHIELQRQRLENEAALKDIDIRLQSEKNEKIRKELYDERAGLLTEQQKSKALRGQVQNFEKKLLSTASDVLNTGRLRRMVRNDMLSEFYGDKILSEDEIKAKKEFEAAQNAASIEDYRNHPDYKKDQAALEAKRSKARAAREAKKAKEPTVTEKVVETAKDVVKKVREKVTGEKKKEAAKEKQKAIDDFPLNDKGQRMTPQEFLEHIKKLRKPC